MTTPNLTALIATACDLKQQMNDHVAELYKRVTQPVAFDKEKAVTGKVLTRQYGPAIQNIVKATTEDDLVKRRDTLDRRLNKGWAYCHLHPDDTQAHEAWEALLLEYQVLSDCVDHIGIVNGTLDRIAWIESFVHPLEQRSLV